MKTSFQFTSFYSFRFPLFLFFLVLLYECFLKVIWRKTIVNKTEYRQTKKSFNWTILELFQDEQLTLHNGKDDHSIQTFNHMVRSAEYISFFYANTMLSRVDVTEEIFGTITGYFAGAKKTFILKKNFFFFLCSCLATLSERKTAFFLTEDEPENSVLGLDHGEGDNTSVQAW